MTNLVINTQAISQHNGLFSLNDLHKVSGNEKRHEPNRFLRNEQTKDLIAEIESENQVAYNTINGGKNRGTYVCRELVYAYAIWISSKFHLMVIRAFDSLTRTDARQRQALVTACDKLAVGNTLRSDVYKMVGNHFGYDDVVSIPAPLLPDAVAFVYEMIIRLQPQNNTHEHGEHNAFWKMVGLMEYHRHDKEIRQLQTAFANVKNQMHQAMNQLENCLDHIVSNKGLIYDALDQQRTKATADTKEQAIAFINRQMLM